MKHAAYACASTRTARYHINGRQRFIRIGCSPGLSLKAAQTRAGELRRIVDEGRDPAGNERDRRWITSFEKFLRHTAEHVTKVSLRGASCGLTVYSTDVAATKGQPLAMVTAGFVLASHIIVLRHTEGPGLLSKYFRLPAQPCDLPAIAMA